MSNLSIKSVPEALAETLRQRAASNHRSLQGELMAILEAAVAQETPMQTEPVKSARGGKSFMEVSAAFRERFPAPLGLSLESASLLREMRDTHYGENWVAGGAKDGGAT